MNFLIVSNMRGSSTWLQTMLVQLHDVVTDYELKWKLQYELAELYDSMFLRQVPVFGKYF
jgi:hypothetical protein